MKKIIIIVCILLLSGCRIDYTLKITNDNKFVEKCDLLKYFPDGNTKYILEDDGGEFDIITELRKQANDKLSTLSFSRYNLSNIDSTKYKGIRLTRNYEGAAAFNYSLLIKELYDDFSVELDKNIVTISAKKLNRDNIDLSYEAIGMTLDNSTITLELPYKVIENNADEINKEKNIYKWYINKDTKQKDILLKYDVDSLYSLNIKTIGVKVNMTIVYIILAILILIIIGYLIYNYIKKIYENRNKF